MFSSHSLIPQGVSRNREAARPARIATAALLALVAALPGGCSGDVARTLATDAGYGPRTVAAPDFVTTSRKAEAPDFMAVGVDAPRRAVRPKSAEGQKALEAELEGVRGRNQIRGRAAESAGKGAGKGIATGAPGPAPAAAQ